MIKLTATAIAVILVANSLVSFIMLQYLSHTWMGEVQTRAGHDLNAVRAAYGDHLTILAALLSGTARDRTLAAALKRANGAELGAMLHDLNAPTNLRQEPSSPRPLSRLRARGVKQPVLPGENPLLRSRCNTGRPHPQPLSRLRERGVLNPLVRQVRRTSTSSSSWTRPERSFAARAAGKKGTIFRQTRWSPRFAVSESP